MNYRTYRIIVENESILVLMEVVKGALRDSVLNFNRAFDVLLLRELRLIVGIGLCLVPLCRRQTLHHAFLLRFTSLCEVGFVRLLLRFGCLLVERQGFIDCVSSLRQHVHIVVTKARD